jgi:hypothetical protein
MSNEQQEINFEACPRYHTHPMTEQQIIEVARTAILLAKDEIAQEALNIAKTQFYLEVGKTVTNKILWLIGASAVALWVWLNVHGIVPKE